MNRLKRIVPFLFFVLAACAGETETQDNKTENANVAGQHNNQIDYVEFAAEDLEKIKAFYANAFGWEFQDWGPDYVSFTGGGIDGGFRGGEKPAPGGALVILYADDLEGAEKRVTAAGGEITERHEFPGGRRFHFRDPAGNVLGVWTKADDEADAD